MYDSFAAPWTTAHQAPLTTGFSRQEYWSGLPVPSPGDLHDPDTEPESLEHPALQGQSSPLRHQETNEITIPTGNDKWHFSTAHKCHDKTYFFFFLGHIGGRHVGS